LDNASTSVSDDVDKQPNAKHSSEKTMNQHTLSALRRPE